MFKIAIIVFIKNIRYFLEYNVAVFVTNQMTADPGATMSYVYILYFIFQWNYMYIDLSSWAWKWNEMFFQAFKRTPRNQ